MDVEFERFEAQLELSILIRNLETRLGRAEAPLKTLWLQELACLRVCVLDPKHLTENHQIIGAGAFISALNGHFTNLLGYFY